MLEVEVSPATPGLYGERGRQPIIGCLQEFERCFPSMSPIDIQHHQPALLSGAYANIGVGPAPPPVPNPIRMAAGLFEAVERPGVFSRRCAAVLPTRASLCSGCMHRQNLPAARRVSQRCSSKGVHARVSFRVQKTSGSTRSTRYIYRLDRYGTGISVLEQYTSPM